MKEKILQRMLQKSKGLRDYYEQLYGYKLCNNTTYQETYNLHRPNQEEIKNVNRPITSKETESVLKYFVEINIMCLFILQWDY